MAVEGGSVPSQQPAQTLKRRDLGDLASAERAARAEIGGPVAMNATFHLLLTRSSRDFEVVAQAREQRKAADLANAFATALVRQRDILIRRRNLELRARAAPLKLLVNQNHSLRPRLVEIEKRLQWVHFLEAVPGAGMSIQQRAAVPRDSIAPRIARDVVAAFLLGFLLGLTPRVARSGLKR
jgi:hypothetical protein